MNGKLFARRMLISTKKGAPRRLLGYIAAFLATAFAYMQRSKLPEELVFGALLLLLFFAWEVLVICLRYWAATEKSLEQLEARYSKRTGSKIVEAPPEILEALKELEALRPKRKFEE